mmetsp:Transcript_30993/g.62902  ORF Transcript_30993/g.62902 Transcript_30993/m.62902 type:complete len:432 (+) Transcript_30993:16-1311(+)
MVRWLMLAVILLLLTMTQALNFPRFLRKSEQLALVPASTQSPPPATLGSQVSQFGANCFKWLTTPEWGKLNAFLGILGVVVATSLSVVHAYFAEDDILVLRNVLSHPDPAALAKLPEVEKPIIFREVLTDRFHDITDKEKQSVLVWGEHKSGKSTFVQETIMAEMHQGRVVLHAAAKTNDTLERLLARLFRWSGNAHWVRRLLRIPTRSTEMPEIDPKELTHLDNPHGLPLLVIDNINKLSTETIFRLLGTAKEFVDKRIGVFVFVLSSGAKGKEFTIHSAMSRVEMLYVGDLTENETLSYLKEVGRTEEEARQIFGLVGGRWEYLLKARTSPFDFNAFRTKWFKEIEAQVLKVSATGWDEDDTLLFLFLFLQGSGQVKSDVFVKKADGTEEAVGRMLKANLIQYRLDESKYELHSQLVKSYLEKKKEGGV